MWHEFLLELERRRWLLVGVTLCAAGLLLPAPEGLSTAGYRVLLITGVALLLYVTEPVPLPTVALLIVVAQVLFGVDTANGVASSFMSDSVFFIMGSLMMGVAISRQNLDRRLALALFPLTGRSPMRLAAVLVVISAGMASLIGEHTVAAILLPVVLALYRATEEEAPHRRVLGALLALAVARGASIAVVGTPSGGARNAVMLEYWSSLHDVQVTYGQWVVWAYPLVLLQIPLVIAVLWMRLRPGRFDLRRGFIRLRRQVERGGAMAGRQWLAVALFGATVLLWVTVSAELGLGTVALLGAAAFLVTGLVDWEDLSEGVNWGVVLIYAANISLGVAMGRTGAAAWLASGILDGLGTLGLGGQPALLLAVPLFGAVLANGMGSGAMVAVFGPIALSLADQTTGDVVAAGLLTVSSSTFAYLTVMGTPANLIVYASGLVRPRDFWSTGWPLLLGSLALLAGLAASYWIGLTP